MALGEVCEDVSLCLCIPNEFLLVYRRLVDHFHGEDEWFGLVWSSIQTWSKLDEVDVAESALSKLHLDREVRKAVSFLDRDEFFLGQTRKGHCHRARTLNIKATVDVPLIRCDARSVRIPCTLTGTLCLNSN